ncbi:hypothetical protein [Micrococcus lylae]|uniref:hypothetical protein n=1 Tax=Micrococcus lylae TaxID=1273 RepID=UPI000C802973|nr:hypothetical protein [Micrococcus lylae]WIK82179.1 hypothetical protein CJ228_011425 [Micrococcus lylae]
MPDALVTTLGTVAVAVLGILGGWWAKRVPEAGAREHALIDQLQEDADRLREDAVRLTAMVDRLTVRERLMADYISRLRLHISEGHGPPAPAWPEGLI